MKRPVEAKVIAAGSGAVAGGGVLGTFALWAEGVLFWHVPTSAEKASAAVAAVPGPVQALTIAIVGGLASFIAGYAAPHTHAGVKDATPGQGS